MKTRRIAPDAASDVDAAVAWAAELLERFGPADVALLDAAAPAMTSRCSGLPDYAHSVHRAAARANLAPIETSRCEVATTLGIGSTTTVAIRLELAERFPFVAAHVSTRRMRSESDRYWEPAVLGAAAALAVAGREMARRP